MDKEYLEYLKPGQVSGSLCQACPTPIEHAQLSNLANEVISIGSVLIQHDTGCAALGKCPFFVKLIVNLFEIDKKISICPSSQINRFLRAT